MLIVAAKKPGRVRNTFPGGVMPWQYRAVNLTRDMSGGWAWELYGGSPEDWREVYEDMYEAESGAKTELAKDK